MASRTECTSFRYFGSVLSGEDIIKERDWNVSLISTMVVTACLTEPFYTPAPHITSVNMVWVEACTAGEANSEGSLDGRPQCAS